MKKSQDLRQRLDEILKSARAEVNDKPGQIQPTEVSSPRGSSKYDLIAVDRCVQLREEDAAGPASPGSEPFEPLEFASSLRAHSTSNSISVTGSESSDHENNSVEYKSSYRPSSSSKSTEQQRDESHLEKSDHQQRSNPQLDLEAILGRLSPKIEMRPRLASADEQQRCSAQVEVWMLEAEQQRCSALEQQVMAATHRAHALANALHSSGRALIEAVDAERAKSAALAAELIKIQSKTSNSENLSEMQLEIENLKRELRSEQEKSRALEVTLHKMIDPTKPPPPGFESFSDDISSQRLVWGGLSSILDEQIHAAAIMSRLMREDGEKRTQVQNLMMEKLSFFRNNAAAFVHAGANVESVPRKQYLDLLDSAQEMCIAAIAGLDASAGLSSEATLLHATITAIKRELLRLRYSEDASLPSNFSSPPPASSKQSSLPDSHSRQDLSLSPGTNANSTPPPAAPAWSNHHYSSRGIDNAFARLRALTPPGHRISSMAIHGRHSISPKNDTENRAKTSNSSRTSVKSQQLNNKNSSHHHHHATEHGPPVVNERFAWYLRMLSSAKSPSADPRPPWVP